MSVAVLVLGLGRAHVLAACGLHDRCATPPVRVLAHRTCGSSSFMISPRDGEVWREGVGVGRVQIGKCGGNAESGIQDCQRNEAELLMYV